MLLFDLFENIWHMFIYFYLFFTKTATMKRILQNSFTTFVPPQKEGAKCKLKANAIFFKK